jgi:hypothetical protein
MKLQNNFTSHILKEYLWNPYHHNFVDRKMVLQIDTKKTNWSKQIIPTTTKPFIHVYKTFQVVTWTNANLVIWCYVGIAILNKMRLSTYIERTKRECQVTSEKTWPLFHTCAGCKTKCHWLHVQHYGTWDMEPVPHTQNHQPNPPQDFLLSTHHKLFI